MPCSACSGVVLRVLFQAKQLAVVSAGDDGEVVYEDVVGRSLVEVSSTHKQPELTPAAAVINETVVVQAPKS